jgi:hypothetical protein
VRASAQGIFLKKQSFKLSGPWKISIKSSKNILLAGLANKNPPPWPLEDRKIPFLFNTCRIFLKNGRGIFKSETSSEADTLFAFCPDIKHNALKA